MTPSRARYEAPAIVERTPIELPLVGTTSAVPSAGFRAAPAYEPPAIAERTSVARPLVLAASSL